MRRNGLPVLGAELEPDGLPQLPAAVRITSELPEQLQRHPVGMLVQEVTTMTHTVPTATAQDLKHRHGEDLVVMTTKMGPLVFRCPTKAVYKKFIRDVSDPKRNRADAMEGIVQDCFVWPEKDKGQPDYQALQAAIERQPGIIGRAADQLLEIAGTEDSLDAGKL